MRRKEAGQALVTAALALVALIAFAGLGIDVGVMRYEKRLQQTAADAGALAGADNLAHPSNGGVIAAAQSASATDGFADNGGGALSACTASGAAVGTTCVQVSDPASGPTTGPHAGDTKYVEVYVSKVHPTYFMKIVGRTTAVVTARAVATSTSGGVNNGCLYTLGPPTAAIQGVNVTGSAILNATTCGIIDNGNFDPTGGALTVHAGSFGASGKCSGSGCGKGSVTCAQTGPCPKYDVPASSDPYAGRLTPPCSPCTGGTSISINGTGTYTENPGTYTSISIKGTGNGPTITFNPGVYIINGGNFTIKGNAAISGSGVTFYFTNGATIDASGGGNKLDFNLTAPSSGQYQGILFYQDPNDTTGPQLGGDNNSEFNGVLYFPSAQLTFFGNAVSYAAGIVVVKSLALSGNPTVNLEGAKGVPGGSTLTVATLVE